MSRIRTLTVFGTRPEAIKLAPVCHALAAAPDDFESRVLVTAQHRDLLDRALADFQLAPDYDLDLMRPNQDLFHTTSAALTGLKDVLQRDRPDVVIVQGDTTTTFVGALAAFYAKVPVAHVEAGLRTGNKYSPFPEEMNRRMTSCLADLHFAPTPGAVENLTREGVRSADVVLTGNTGIDAVMWVLRHRAPTFSAVLPERACAALGRRYLLLTTHRRESFGAPMLEALGAVREICEARPDVSVLFPVHPNPNVRSEVAAVLSGLANVHLTDPLDYVNFAHLMAGAEIILTDSGGIQEEAPSLSRPVVVLREATERPEGVAAGVAVLVGTKRVRIRGEVLRLLQDSSHYRSMIGKPNPYGDGTAAARIVDTLQARMRS